MVKTEELLVGWKKPAFFALTEGEQMDYDEKAFVAFKNVKIF